jgi:leucyl-tRNA synthetase
MLAITKYTDRLDRDLDKVNYLEKIKIQQRNWIGKSEGSEIEFKIDSDVGRLESPDVQRPNLVKVFTTRADTLFGATYVVLAPEHELVEKLKSQITNWDEVESYIKEVKNKTVNNWRD